MSHSGMKTPHPDWLGQVKEVTVKPEHAEGRSETGAALAALADELGADEPFSTGELMGVEIDRGIGGLAFAVMVSTGCAEADVQRVAHAFAVKPEDVSLLSPAVMLTQGQFTGLAQVTPIL